MVQFCSGILVLIGTVFFVIGVAGMRSMQKLPADPRQITSISLYQEESDRAAWMMAIGFGISLATFFIALLISIS